MIFVSAVVLLMASVVSSMESPKNLVSKDISVLPRPPGVLSPGQQHAVTPGGSVHALVTVFTREGASRLFVNQGSTTSEIEEKFRKSTASDKMRNKRKR